MNITTSFLAALDAAPLPFRGDEEVQVEWIGMPSIPWIKKTMKRKHRFLVADRPELPTSQSNYCRAVQ